MVPIPPLWAAALAKSISAMPLSKAATSAAKKAEYLRNRRALASASGIILPQLLPSVALDFASIYWTHIEKEAERLRDRKRHHDARAPHDSSSFDSLNNGKPSHAAFKLCHMTDFFFVLAEKCVLFPILITSFVHSFFFPIGSLSAVVNTSGEFATLFHLMDF